MSDQAVLQKIEAVRAAMGEYSVQDSPPMQILSAMLDLCRTMQQRVEATASPIVSEEALLRAVRQGTAANARGVLHAMNWRNVLIGAGLIVGALLIGGGVSGAVGYWQGYNSGVTDGSHRGLQANAMLAKLPPADAAWWAELINDNPTVSKSLAACTRYTDGKRSACALPLWLEGAPPPAAK